MTRFENSGMSLKLMSILSGVNFSTLYKYIQNNNFSPMPTATKRNAKFSIEDVRKILGKLYGDKHPIRKDKNVLTQFHFKGGVGKTALSVSIAVLLSLLNKKVLLVDADQQGHASISLGLNHSEKHLTLFDGIKNGLNPSSLIIQIFDGLSCIPSNLSLGGIEEFIYGYDEHSRHKILYDYMYDLKGEYDFIVFDTPPNITNLNRSIFYFSDVLNVVNDLMPESVNSLSYIIPELEDFYNKKEKAFPDMLIIPNLYEDRVSSCLESMTLLKTNWEKFLIPDFAIRKSEDFPKSFKEQTPIPFFCKVNSIAFEDVSLIVRELIKLSGVQNKI